MAGISAIIVLQIKKPRHTQNSEAEYQRLWSKADLLLILPLSPH